MSDLIGLLNVTCRIEGVSVTPSTFSPNRLNDEHVYLSLNVATDISAMNQLPFVRCPPTWQAAGPMDGHALYIASGDRRAATQ